MTSNALLLASVARLLRIDEDLQSAVYLWRRSRLSFPFAAAAAVVVGLVSVALGIGSLGSTVAMMLAAAGVAVLASTEYRVLARTQRGFVLCRASRVRRAAVEVMRRYPSDLDLERTAGAFLFTEWLVDDSHYNVPRRDEAAMTEMALVAGNPPSGS